MSILLALKRATAASHARAELAFPTQTEFAEAEVHRGVISRLHAFYRVWEPAVWASAEVTALLDGESATRRKLPLLDADLAHLRLDSAWAEPAADVLPPVLSPLGALGALYVMEGSTLGGRVILAWLPRETHDAARCANAFFSGYGARTGEMWREFGRRMDAHVAVVGGEDEIIAGAVSCFDAFEAAMRSAAFAPHSVSGRHDD